MMRGPDSTKLHAEKGQSRRHLTYAEFCRKALDTVTLGTDLNGEKRYLSQLQQILMAIIRKARAGDKMALKGLINGPFGKKSIEAEARREGRDIDLSRLTDEELLTLISLRTQAMSFKS